MGRREAIPLLAQIEDFELIGGGFLVLGELDIDAPDPVPIRFEELHHVMADEAPGTGDTGTTHQSVSFR
jgi:hypothetical protein